MNPLLVLTEAPAIIAALKVFETTIGNCIQQKRAPNAADDAAMIDACEKLLATGLIQIPGLSDDQITAALEEIKKIL